MVLKLAIQKSGRLHEDSVKLLKECGIEINNNVKNQLKATAANFPLEVFFLRDDDIPQYVEDGVADIGFVGENVVYESKKNVKVAELLGFGKCRLSIATTKNDDYTGPEFLQGKKIATSYPVLVQQFLSKNNIQAEIHEISGSVEIAPSIGLADAVCDLVSSGSTLFMNGLKETEIILQSQSALIQTPELNQEKNQILQKLLFRIQTVKKAKSKKYVLMNVPNDKLDRIIKMLPGMKSPTVLPLAAEGWSSIHTVLSENEFWEHIEEIKAAGAEDILVLPIEKMIV
ncbi:ATP phosphoribosyltransferase [Arachidicoccus rhizosphaerae]|jgi:ATP phosphoribosyltransferase|uniref:ATP phosphoribosyltransferase n=1 Tax=Arachidicoccus rhizosphaerae TaxID=551991 RepID=A0A1H3WHZ1_9BACT|nr:ATP phosphoribosyltransferase [Arachidicoccus rhizosphaerae]SDZ86777.1 ATP phosphoribosyltransferase [Arachidicoccus rhizosphaerae]